VDVLFVQCCRNIIFEKEKKEKNKCAHSMIFAIIHHLNFLYTQHLQLHGGGESHIMSRICLTPF
jgi:hypothetical protein